MEDALTGAMARKPYSSGRLFSGIHVPSDWGQDGVCELRETSIYQTSTPYSILIIIRSGCVGSRRGMMVLFFPPGIYSEGRTEGGLSGQLLE